MWALWGPWALCGALAGCGSSGSGASPADQPPRLTRLDVLAGQPGGRGWVDGALVAAHFQEPWEITGDGGKTLYVADANVIRAIDGASGTVTTLAGVYGHPGSSDGVGAAATFNLPSGLALAGDQLYLSDTENHTIRKIDLASGAVTTVAGAAGERGAIDGPAPDARFGEPEGIALDPSGRLYISDTDNDTIRVLDLGSGTVGTIAGTAGNSGSADGIGPAASFSKPKAMRIDAAGDLYVVDALDQAVRKIVPSSGAVTTVASFQALPQGLAVDGSDVLVSLQGTSGENRIARVTPDGTVSTLAGSVSAAGFVDGPAADARFDSPAGLYADGTGTLYVADAGNFVVRAVTLGGGTVETYAGALSTGSADGTGSQARFKAPQGLAVDDDAVYVADTGNDTIRRIDLGTGDVTTLAGAVGEAGHADGALSDARFDGPQGLALDPSSQTLYVADTLNRAIRKIDLRRGLVSTPSYAAVPPFGGLDAPSGLAVDGQHLYVADASDDDVASVDLQSGDISLLAGQFGVVGTADGVGASAGFYTPLGVAADGRGSLYVVDNQGCTVRRVAIRTAAVSTIAGHPAKPGVNDGAGAQASFAYPFGVAANDLGDLFVSDTNNNAIRHVDTASGTVTTVIGAPALGGVRLGMLPAQLTQPSAIALARSGRLYVVSENAVLVAH